MYPEMGGIYAYPPLMPAVKSLLRTHIPLHFPLVVTPPQLKSVKIPK